MNATTGPARAALHPSARGRAQPRQPMIDQLSACFAFPGLSNIAAALEERRMRRRGARPQYPDICMLAVLAAARAVGGVQPVVRELSSANGVAWRACTERLTARVPDLRLPATAPTRDHIQSFQDRIERDELIAVLEDAFVSASVRMAQWLGHFDSQAAPEWVQPDARHTIYGDGTVIRPYSNVTSWEHPRTKETITRGSRAKDASSARIQTIRTDTALDGKGDRYGINFVSMHTWTSAGRVVLATGHALGAESWVATDLMRKVQEHAAGGVHTVVYDGVVDGWIVDWLMGALRVQPVNIVKVLSKTDPHAPTRDRPVRIQSALVASRTHAERLLASVGLDSSPELIEYERVAAIRRLYDSDEPLPVGLCIYPRAGGKSFEVVYSRHHLLGDATHTVGDSTCAHHLVIDDGALYVAEADIERDHLVKVAMPTCLSASAERNAPGPWNRTTTWEIPCEHGDFTHTLTWHPTGEFRAPGAPRQRTDPLADLRPLARAHPGFGAVYGRRNDSESYNQWFQASLRHPGTAMSLSLTGQRLDFLMGAVLNNALTYDRAVNPTRRP